MSSRAVGDFPTYARVPLLIVCGCSAILLAVFYAVGFVLPSWLGCGCWVFSVGIALSGFRLFKVPVLSLSSAVSAFYFYVAVVFFWTAIYPQVFIAVHAVSFQTAGIFAKANHLVAIGSFALETGWLAAFSGRRTWPRKELDGRTPFPVGPNAFLPAVLLAVPFLALSLPSTSILTAAYGSINVLGADFQINIFKGAAIVSLLLALAAVVQRPTPARRAVVGGLFLVLCVAGFASGGRVEEVGCLLGAAWVIQGARKRRRLPRLWLLGAGFLCAFMLTLGELRSSVAATGLSLDAVAQAVEGATQVFPNAATLHMKPSTNGDIAVTLCAVVGLVDTSVLSIDGGATFLQYARMTLPRFLNPDRPDELEVTLSRMRLSGGGLYVLAEPYLSGGAFGVLVVMALFGSLVGSLEARYTGARLTKVSYLFYLLLLSCVPRWLLYSSFSMYKHVLTGIIVFFVVRIASALFDRCSRMAVGPVAHAEGVSA